MSLCAAQSTVVGVDLKFNVVIMLISKRIKIIIKKYIYIKPGYD